MSIKTLKPSNYRSFAHYHIFLDRDKDLFYNMEIQALKETGYTGYCA